MGDAPHAGVRTRCSATLRAAGGSIVELTGVLFHLGARLSRAAARGWRLPAALSPAIIPVVMLVVAIGLGWHYSLPSAGTSAPAVRLYAGDRPVALAHPTGRAQDWVAIDRMPGWVVDAVVAAEDRRFWTHPGVDVRGIGRALWTDLRNRDLREGASTITQQLARTLFLGNDRTWSRKLAETAIALSLEARYSKRRILEAYLNTVYLGHDGDTSVHGVPAASQQYLGKEITAVTVDEAAWLAAAIRGPNRLLPSRSADARERRDRIVQALATEGRITEAAARTAVARPLPRRVILSGQAPYFVDTVLAEVARRGGAPSGDLVLHTTLDPALQTVAEKAVRDGTARIEKSQPKLAGSVQIAVVAIEPGSGAIRAVVGGRGFRSAPYNRATRALRQPGSLFKPFVYLAAFERDGQRFTPTSMVEDEPVVIPTRGGEWAPRNIDGEFRGPVTVRRALEESLNVPAVRVAASVGPRRVSEMARAAGIEHPVAAVPSIALGTSEVSLLEITAAFATLANQGVRVPPTTLDAGMRDGGTVDAGTAALAPLPSPTRVVSAESAFLTTYLLRGVMQRGTGASSSAWGLNGLTAGKTGTSDGLRDAWFVGYTPDLVVGVWVGIDDGRPLSLTGAQAALPVWGPIMQAAVRRQSPPPFTPPPGIVFADVSRATGQAIGAGCESADAVREAFREGTVPAAAECGTPVAATVAAVWGWLERLVR